MIHFLALFVALAISSVAGYFSIYGLGLVFSGAFWSAVVLGIALEIGKITSVSWLYRNWEHASNFLRFYLFVAILVLSFITGLGTFGFLSRAYIEQRSLIDSGAKSQIELIDSQLNQKKEQIKDVDNQLQITYNALNKLVDSNQAARSINLADQQRRNVQNLTKTKSDLTQDLFKLQADQTKLKNANNQVEVEVGPIKYVAAIFFGNSDLETVDKTVRILIIIICFVFDPLAISLLIAANSGFKSKRLDTKDLVWTKDGFVNIKESDIKDIK